jgi:chorismate synthase
VAAGAIAEKILHRQHGVEIVAWVSSVGNIECPPVDLIEVSRIIVDRTPVRCPDPTTAVRMTETITRLKQEGDSIGGVVCCVVRHLPIGLGEPVFDKLEALLAHAMLSMPATKGFEIGSGFAGTRMQGSVHNDPFVKKGDRLGTRTNHSGGTLGGISNGEPLYFRVAFKPPATIQLPQETVDFEGNPTILEARGRHDPCVVPRAVPIVEAMTALTLCDLLLRQKMRA